MFVLRLRVMSAEEVIGAGGFGVGFEIRNEISAKGCGPTAS